jgi:hypothetical protein
MIRGFYTVALLLALALCRASAAPDFAFTWRMNEQEEKLVVDGARLQKTPEADPERGVLPITFEQAGALALAAIPEFKATIQDISLTPTRQGPRRWLYVVSVGGSVGKNYVERHVAVLMDGTVARGVMKE